MAKNEVSIFDAGQVPAHITDFNQNESNIVARNNADRLTIKGKVFTVQINGNKQTLMKKNEDGDDEPRPTIPVVVLGYAARRGRAYYADGFNEAAPKAPTCWSKDGIKPDKEVEEKQCAKCGECEMSKKGSKVTDAGVESKACSEHRFLAVQLYRKWDIPPLQLRLAITSDYDTRNKEQEAKGWYAWSQYTDMLRARGVKHTASVVTRLKFDHSSAYPKLLFSAVGWVSPEELEIVSPLSKSDEVQSLINPVFTVGGDQTNLPKEDPEEDDPELTPAKPKGPTGKGSAAAGAKNSPASGGKPAGSGTSKPKPKPAPEPEEEPEEEAEEEAAEGEVVTEDDEDAAAEAAAAKARADAKARKEAKAKAEADKAKKDAAAKKKATAEASDDDDDDGDGKVVVTKPKASNKPAAGKPAPTGAAPEGTPAAGKPAKVKSEVGAIIDAW